MSQIGEGKAAIEGLGRLLGAGEGKAGRLPAGLGGGAREEFARLMASAQGRFPTDGKAGEMPVSRSSIAGQLGQLDQGGEELAEALAGLAEQLAQLREALGGKSGDGGAAGESLLGEAELEGMDALRSALDDLSDDIEGRLVRLEEMAGKAGDWDAGDEMGRGPVQGKTDRAAVDDWPGLESSAWGDVSESSNGELAETITALRDEVEALTEALSGLEQSVESGQPQVALSLTELTERLSSLRESVLEARREGGAGRSAMPAGLPGQLQALEQALQRAQSAAGGEAQLAQTAQAARGAGARGEESVRDGNWRFAETGRRSGGNAESARLGGVAAADAGRDADWSGGPVSAALGLTGRESPALERASLTRWSVLNGLEGQAVGRGEPDSLPAGGSAAATGVGGSPSAPLSGSSPSTGIFTGQPATGAPNPQMPAQLGQQIQWMVGKGVSRANIELRPADLGPLKIAIETQGDETRIALTATNATAQGLLEQQLPRLKEWLQEAGLADSEVEVGLGQESDFGQQLADADEGGQGSAGGAGGGADSSGGEQIALAADGSDGGDTTEEGRLILDLFA
ncbi:MAG: flagellar hook-length control protein FliK [Guyparkeria sp.]